MNLLRKVTVVVLMITICFNLASQEQRISLNLKNVTVLKFIEAVEKASEFTFSYDPTLINTDEQISIKVENSRIKEILKEVLSPLNIQYTFSNKHIILKRAPKKATISGFIYDQESKESLIAATIYDKKSRRGAHSNNYGFYSLTLNEGEIDFISSYVGYKKFDKTFTLNGDTVINLYLKPSLELEEVVVEGNRNNPVFSSEMGKISLSSAMIKSTPSILGESDLIKTLQLMPGVSAGTEGLTGLYVRGGNSSENLYLLDGTPLYHVNHLLGFFSTFNPEAIKNTSFYKGSFPARYGGRLSSVVDVRTIDGDMNKIKGSFSIALISSRFNINGPIIKDKTSFSFSARRTYLDLITRPIVSYLIAKETKDENGKTKGNAYYNFYDINAKINHKISDRSRLYFNFYMGNDVLNINGKKKAKENELDMKGKLDFSWGNMLSTINWNYIFSNKLFMNSSLIYCKYKSPLSLDIGVSMKENENSSGLGLNNHFKYNDILKFSSGIRDIGFRADFDYTPLTNHNIKFGTSAIRHQFSPERARRNVSVSALGEKMEQDFNFENSTIKANELTLYVEDDYDINSMIKINAGFHSSWYNVSNKNYLSFQPRISARLLLDKTFSIKGSYAQMSQNVHLLQSTYLNMPTDLWVPVTDKIKPMTSHQVSLGAYKTYKKIEFSMETYFKTMNRIIEYKDITGIFSQSGNWQDKVAQGKGRAYGIEIMAQKNIGKVTGWIGYDLSWSERQFTGGEIEGGNWYPSTFDNRHKINIVSNYKVSNNIDLGASWIYSTGNNISIPIENYRDIDGEFVSHTGIRNNYKLPGYHRMDLSFKFHRPKKSGRKAIWEISVYNVYNRLNAFMVIRDDYKPREYDKEGNDITKENTRNEIRYFKVSLFPIIPSVSYTYIF